MKKIARKRASNPSHKLNLGKDLPLKLVLRNLNLGKSSSCLLTILLAILLSTLLVLYQSRKDRY
jgi:hypothetical protein